MHGEHLHVQSHRRGDSFGDGVRDVVKFQIKEHRGSRRANLPDDVRPGAREQFAANLECADYRRDFFGQLQRGFGRWHIQRGDDGIAHSQFIQPQIEHR